MSFALSTRSAAVALALFAMVPATTTLAHAKVCKSNSVSAAGAKKSTNLGARLSARFAWDGKVRGMYGIAYASYLLAANKGYDCHRVGLKWRCEAYGRPCRLGN